MLRGLGILRGCQSENIVKRENQRSGGKRGEEIATRPGQTDTPSVGCLPGAGIQSSLVCRGSCYIKLLWIEGPRSWLTKYSEAFVSEAMNNIQSLGSITQRPEPGGTSNPRQMQFAARVRF